MGEGASVLIAGFAGILGGSLGCVLLQAVLDYIDKRKDREVIYDVWLSKSGGVYHLTPGLTPEEARKLSGVQMSCIIGKGVKD